MVCTIVICPNCGKETPEGKFCEHCGASVQTTQTFQQPVAQQPAIAKQEINAVLAALLSIFPGAGLAYVGNRGKGIGILIVAFILMILANASPIFGLLYFIVWAYGIYDSYMTAQKMNKGEIPYTPANIGVAIGFIVVEIIIWGLYFIAVGSGYPYY